MYRTEASLGLLLSVALASGCLPDRPETPTPRLAYLAAADSNLIVAIDLDERRVVGEYGGFATPHGAVITPDGADLYGASFEVDYLTVVNVETGASRAIDLGSTTHHLRVAPEGDVIYVTLGSEGAVAFIDRQSDAVLARIPSGKAPFDLAIAPDGAALYVANTGSGDLSKIDVARRERVGLVATGDAPTHVVVTADGSTVYVTNAFSGTVSEIDTATMEKRRDFEVGRDAHGIVLSPDESKLLVSGWEGRLVEIDRASGALRDVAVASDDTHGIGLSPDADLLLICDTAGNRVIALDPDTLEERFAVAVPASPHQISFVGW